MTLRKFYQVIRGERGITLVEILVGIVIAAVIIPAASMGIFQITNGTAKSNNRNTAITNIQNAGEWISWDTRMAQNVTTSGHLPLNLTWANDTANITVSYSLSGTDIIRSYQIDTGAPTTMAVARHINVPPSLNYANNNLNLTITATVGAGSQAVTETRGFQIQRRAGG